MSLYIDICTPFKKGQQNGLMVLSCCSVQGRVADPIWYMLEDRSRKYKKMVYSFFSKGGR